jgi:hypothetical protein
MPLGQRIAHVLPERCPGVLDLLRSALVDAFDGVSQVLAGLAEAPIPFVGDVLEHLAECAGGCSAGSGR